MTDEGRMPFRERKENPVEFPVGDHGPFEGNAPARPDDEIKRDVETALFYDEAVSSIGIQVSVQAGVVTLNGKVESDQAKRLAGEDAWEVAGVRNVENNLEVHETPTEARAAGQGVVETKPPEPIYGEPPEISPAQKSTAGGSGGQTTPSTEEPSRPRTRQAGEPREGFDPLA